MGRWVNEYVYEADEQECRDGVAAALARLEALDVTEEEARANPHWDWRERNALEELDRWRWLLGED